MEIIRPNYRVVTLDRSGNYHHYTVGPVDFPELTARIRDNQEMVTSTSPFVLQTTLANLISPGKCSQLRTLSRKLRNSNK